MECVDNPVAHLVSDLLAWHGVRRVVVSSGTRCSPLVVTLNRSGSFELIPVIDERAAAFIALGISSATGEPVALVCTSGTALLNYAPALAEAYYRQIPLIAVTADRPRFRIDRLDSQTIRQPGALDNIVGRTVNIPAEARNEKSLFSLANLEVNEVLNLACGPIEYRLPVHINVEIDEPLTEMTSWEPGMRGYGIEAIRPESFGGSGRIEEIISGLRGKRVLVVAGALNEADIRAVENLRHSDVAVIAEAQANIDFAIPAGTVDRYLRDGFTPPEIVVSIGGSLVSGRLKMWLKNCHGLRHIAVGHYPAFPDTFGALRAVIDGGSSDFLCRLAEVRVDAAYKEDFVKMAAECRLKNISTIAGNKLLSTLDKIISEGPRLIHSSNGSAIRYIQFLSPEGKHIECNRGASGIDGSTSTALGFALAVKEPVMLISGDVSAAYDIGALGAARFPEGFRLVVLDNRGGDIFRNIKATRSLAEREKLITCPPALPLADLARGYGFDYEKINVADGSLSVGLPSGKRPAIIHLIIDPEISKKLL